MLLWWKEYAREWKTSLFLVLQMVLVLFWVNARVSSLAEEYEALSVAEVTDSNMYFYRNAIGVLRDDWGFEGFRHAVEKLRQMDGFEEIAYGATMGCEVQGYQNSASEEYSVEISNTNLSPQMWKGLRYRLESGRWFNGQDAADDILQIVIGGGLSNQYQVGDTLVLQYVQGEVKKEAVVIGDLGTDFRIVDESFGLDGQYLGSYFGGAGENGDIILSNDITWEKEFRDMAEYPYLSVMVKLEEGTDLSVYKKYGVLASFDEVMANTRERCRGFLWEAINNNAIWILVIIFGVFGTSYITAKNRRYSWGIYSLLGMTGNELLRRLMLQNALTYLLGGVAACVAAPHLAKLLNYGYDGFGIENAIATGTLIVVLFAVSYLCNRYIRRIEPKEILNQVKE